MPRAHGARGVSRGKAHQTGRPAPFDTPARPFGCGKLNSSLIGHSGTRGLCTYRRPCTSLFEPGPVHLERPSLAHRPPARCAQAGDARSDQALRVYGIGGGPEPFAGTVDRPYLHVVLRTGRKTRQLVAQRPGAGRAARSTPQPSPLSAAKVYEPNASTNLKKSTKSTLPLPSRSKRASVPP